MLFRASAAYREEGSRAESIAFGTNDAGEAVGYRSSITFISRALDLGDDADRLGGFSYVSWRARRKAAVI